MNRHDILPGLDVKSHRIFKGTWALKFKLLPDRIPIEYKSHYCVHGGIQTEGVDYFKNYTPIVQWSTISLALTRIISKNYHTK